VPFKLDVVIKI